MAHKTTIAMKIKNTLWLLLFIFAGIAVFFAASILKKGPSKSVVSERPVKVRAIKIAKVDVIPHAVGYGKIQPARTWDAVAEIAGQITWISDKLRDGRVVGAGEEVLRIEDSNYQLAFAQAQAQINASRVKSKTAHDTLEIAEKELKLLQADYQRKEKLAKNGTISRATVQAAERPLLSGRSRVASLRNGIDLIRAEHQVLIAHRDAAKLDLARTQIIAPFDIRIINVKIGVAQYANKGQLLFSADGLEAVEVTAQFPVGILRPLIAASSQDDGIEARRGALNLQAVVRLHTATHSVEWPARVSRVSGTVDPQTQSLGVVVTVDRPAELAVPGERPPLFRNTFVEVKLVSTPLKERIIVPLNAIHQGMVYVIDADMRLEKRKIEISFSQKNYAMLQNALKPGERIVTSDLITALEGMLLAPIEDMKTKRRMIKEATGKEPRK